MRFVAALKTIACASLLVGCGASTGSSSHGKALAPANVPCGFRPIVRDAWALALPELWQEAPAKNDLLFAATGPMTQVWLDSTTWNGDSKTFGRRVVAAMNARGEFEYVAHHWVVLGGEDALFVEHRHADVDHGRYWREWQLLGASEGHGWELMCRADESVAEAARAPCEVVLDSLVVE